MNTLIILGNLRYHVRAPRHMKPAKFTPVMARGGDGVGVWSGSLEMEMGYLSCVTQKWTGQDEWKFSCRRPGIEIRSTSVKIKVYYYRASHDCYFICSLPEAMKNGLILTEDL